MYILIYVYIYANASVGDRGSPVGASAPSTGCLRAARDWFYVIYVFCVKHVDYISVSGYLSLLSYFLRAARDLPPRPARAPVRRRLRTRALCIYIHIYIYIYIYIHNIYIYVIYVYTHHIIYIYTHIYNICTYIYIYIYIYIYR